MNRADLDKGVSGITDVLLGVVEHGGELGAKAKVAADAIAERLSGIGIDSAFDYSGERCYIVDETVRILTS